MIQLKSWQLVLFIAFISFVLTAAEVASADRYTTAAIRLSAGIAALSLMAAAVLLGGYWGFVETCSGGLERVYHTHKWLGIWTLAFASFHFLFKA